MGQITINGEIYGTNSTRDILDKNNRVLQEVLDESNVIHKEITQEEYNKLENAENDGILYFITDGMSEEGYDFNKNLAEAFDNTKDYKLAEYCIFNNKLYRFVEAKPAGDWDESKVAQAIVTTDFRTLVDYLDEMQTKVDDCFQSVSDGKAMVASAVTGKGVITAQDATFETIATNIGKIKDVANNTAGTATAADISQGITAWVNGKKITGTRPAPAVRLTGTVTMPSKLESGDNYSGNVTFNPTFDITPNVTYTKSVNSVNYASEMSVTISNITRTGFSFKIAPNLSEHHSYLGISSFTWVAQI